MKKWQNWALVMLCIVALTFLPGAGCTHHNADISGTVIVSAELAHADGGKLRFWFDVAGAQEAIPMWGPVFDIRDSYPLQPACGANTAYLFHDKTWEYDFEFCSWNVGVDYEAWLGAFIDLNDNETLDEGEPYGEWVDNPLTRSKEDDHGEHIEIFIELPD